MDKSQITYISLSNGIIATLYYNESFQLGAVVAKGAPGSWDEGNSDYKSLSEKYKINIIVPDYLGFARSNGASFNIKNCVNSIIYCVDFLKGTTTGTIYPKNKRIKFKCKKILMIGSSFGGSIIPLIPKFYPTKTDLKYIGLIAPLTDWETQATDPSVPEESMEEFNYLMQNILHNIYRDYINSEFYAMTQGDREAIKQFNPIQKENIELLKNHKVYIAHGDKDKSINWQKSKKYYQDLKNNKIIVKLNILKNVKHGGVLKRNGLEWILRNFIKEIKTKD